MSEPLVKDNHRFDDHRGFPNKQAIKGTLEPLKGLVMVEPDFGNNETKSGILLADKRAKDIPKMGWVLAKAHDVTNIEIGDYVVFNSYQARGFWNDGVAHIPVEHDNVLAIIGDRKR